MKHTKGPWIVNEVNNGIMLSHSHDNPNRVPGFFAEVRKFNGYATAIANAKRIVACINACEGITTEALEDGVVEWAVNIATDTAKIFNGDDPMKVWEEV
jgi:uncharacterized protein YmfQ (DUF2313 family)